jgi:hypothetical protein
MLEKNQYLLSVDNTKSSLDKLYGYLSGIQYFDPSYNEKVCQWKTAQCFALCLRKSGRLVFNKSQKVMRKRTEFYYSDPVAYQAMIEKELTKLEKTAKKKGLIPTARLNGTSDLDFSSIYRKFPGIQFREYTKGIEFYFEKQGKEKNVHFVYSVSEKTTENEILRVLESGGQCAMVMKEKTEKYLGFPVVDGDNNDLTFLKPKGIILALKPKGKAKKATKNGFIKIERKMVA